MKKTSEFRSFQIEERCHRASNRLCNKRYTQCDGTARIGKFAYGSRRTATKRPREHSRARTQMDAAVTTRTLAVWPPLRMDRGYRLGRLLKLKPL